MPKKKKPEIPKEVKALVDEFAKSLSTVDGKVPLPPAIEYLMEKISYSGSPKINPVVVAGKDIEKLVVGYSAKTAANDRCRKVGPKFFMVGSRPYYLVKTLIDYFTQNPVETFNNE